MTKFNVLVANLESTKDSAASYAEGAAALKKLIKKREQILVAMKKSRKQHSQANITTKFIDRCYTEAVAELKTTVIRYLNIRDRRDEFTKLAYELELLFKKADIPCVTES